MTTMSNVLDWEAAYNFQITPIALGTVEVPALVVRGADSHPAVQRANELVAYYMPQAAGMALSGAAHFMIATHPRELADLITRHVIANEPALRIHRDLDSPDAKRIGDLSAL
jgi:hypothetical protein